MKKTIIAAAIFFSISKTNAQVFTIPHDTVKAVVSTYQNMYNDITNISTGDIAVSWNVVSHDFPSDWAAGFAICDNNNCYYNANNLLLDGKNYTTANIQPTKKGNFYVLPDVTNASPGTHYVQVRMAFGSQTTDSWYIISKFTTGISSIEKLNANIWTYPNPSLDDLTIVHDGSLRVAEVVIMNISGSVVYQKAANGDNNIKVDTRSFTNGMYYAKLVDKDGMTLGYTKFIHY